MTFVTAQVVEAGTLWWGYPWPDVLTGVGTCALAIFAVGTIWVTAVLAKRDRRDAEARAVQERKDADARAIVARQEADKRLTEEREQLRLRERTKQARDVAIHLARVLIEEWPKTAMNQIGAFPVLGLIQLELTLGLPLLDDEELIRRVQELRDLLVEFASYNATIPEAGSTTFGIDEGGRQKMLAARQRYMLALSGRMKWVVDCLIARASDRPMRTPGRWVSEPMPELAFPDD